MRMIYFYSILFLAFLMLNRCSRLKKNGIEFEPSKQELEKYAPVFVDIRLHQSFTNPYDPRDIRVDMLIETDSISQIELPCFYLSGDARESLWQARYTPMAAGRQQYRFRCISGGDTLFSDTAVLQVKESQRNGFLRLHSESNYVLRFDSGKLFRGIGMNLGWELESPYKHPYETYIRALQENHANFYRTWMCPWNLPLEWSRVVTYQKFIDEFEDWSKVFYRSEGLKVKHGPTGYTEEDTTLVTVEATQAQEMIYQLPNIKRFRLKMFYNGHLNKDRIKCSYSSDNHQYVPIDFEYSQTWYTRGQWQRIFLVYIYELPDSSNFLKLEFLPGIEGSPHLASIEIEYGDPVEILDAPGLGRYYEGTARRLDEILSYSEEMGQYVMLTLDYHGQFKSEIDIWASNAEWRHHPYNKKNGGPCETPTDFFTHPEAKRNYKNRLRYMVARWGYSTHLACWEFFNEIDNAMEWQNIPAEAIAAWHREMAGYLRSIDPYKHLISTSVTYRPIPGLWEIENIDFTQHHNYGPSDNMKESILQYEQKYHKPDVVGEFALSWKGPGKDYTVEEYEKELHLGLWRGMFSPTPILPLTWWWEWHYHFKHYYHFRVAMDFMQNMLSEGDDLNEIQIRVQNSALESMALSAGNKIFVWLHNKEKTPRSQFSLQLFDVEDGNFWLSVYDTHDGIFTKEMKVSVQKGHLHLEGIELSGGGDIAFYLEEMNKYQFH